MSIDLKNKVVFITGASRGIGREIALKFAGEGAAVVVAAKSDEPHPTLEGTIHTVAEEVEQAGGKALAIKVDVRDEDNVQAAVEQAVSTFGGIDVLINNASAIHMMPTDQTPLKRYDLMLDVNARGTFLCTKVCAPHLKKSEIGHIVTLSPPVNMDSKWLGMSPAYALSKYGMSILTLGFAKEFGGEGVKANTLWPATMIDTDAIRVNFPEMAEKTRTPAIVADAVHALVAKLAPAPSGQSFTDEEILKQVGIDDFSSYALNADKEPIEDIFLD